MNPLFHGGGIHLRATLTLLLSPFLIPCELADCQGVNRKGGFGRLFKKKTEPEATSTRAAALKKVVMGAIPDDRHYRETLADAIVIAYEDNKYRPLWNRRQLPERLFQSLSSHLARHGIPEIMILDPNGISELCGGAPVNQKDLGYTIVLADAGALTNLGPVAPSTIWPEWNTGDRPGIDREEPRDIASDLLALASQSQFDAGLIIDQKAPRNWIYGELQRAYLVSQRALKYADRIPGIPHPAVAGVAKPGEPYEHAPAIAEALAVRGLLEMPPEERTRLRQMSPELTEALKKFQQYRGLDVDGIMGPGTWKYLAASPAATYRQRALNLHRARLLPDDFGHTYVIINLPSGELYAFDGNELAFSMRIVFGKDKEKHHTPVFRDIMREVVFAPYWNVPTSIASEEILPKLLEDPEYLEKRSYEIVDSFIDDARVYELTEETLSKLTMEQLYLRQRPIPGNALGKVKFLLPNRFNVYLHDTPSKEFFKSDDRAQSHGCIRVESPPQMARWTLERQGWSAEQIDQALGSDTQIRAPLLMPINVYITYFTVFPRPSANPDQPFVLSKPRDVYKLDEGATDSLNAFIP